MGTGHGTVELVLVLELELELVLVLVLVLVLEQELELALSLVDTVGSWDPWCFKGVRSGALSFKGLAHATVPGGTLWVPGTVLELELELPLALAYPVGLRDSWCFKGVGSGAL